MPGISRVSTGGTSRPVWKMPRLYGRNSTATNFLLPQALSFAKKYEGKGEKVELEEGVKKSVVVKLITEEGNGP